MTPLERLVLLASGFVSFATGFMVTRRIADEWLGLNGLTMVTIALLAGGLTSVIGLLVGFNFFALPRACSRIELKRASDLDAIAAWQVHQTDPVLGTPKSVGEPILDGKWGERLKQFEGRVAIDPPQRLLGPIRILAHIRPQGFSEQQRQFYRRLLSNHEAMIDSYYSVLNAAFRAEFPTQGDFPHDTSIHGLEIGPMTGDQLGETILTLEYDQDAYVDVGITNDKVTSVHFWM